jgi:hypothetical protein
VELRELRERARGLPVRIKALASHRRLRASAAVAGRLRVDGVLRPVTVRALAQFGVTL